MTLLHPARLCALLALLLVSVPAAAQVEVQEEPFETAEAEGAARDLMREIRCLVCQNQSIEDSDADLAKDLRILVRERLRAGDTNEEVKAYLVARYGDWVLLEPPVNGGTLILWGSPLLFILIAALVLMRRRAPDTSPLSSEEQATLDRLTGAPTTPDGGSER